MRSRLPKPKRVIAYMRIFIKYWPSVPAAVVHNEIFELKTNFTIINIYLVVFYVYASKHTIHIRPVEGVCFCYVLFYTHPTTYIHLFSRIPFAYIARGSPFTIFQLDFENASFFLYMLLVVYMR